MGSFIAVKAEQINMGEVRQKGTNRIQELLIRMDRNNNTVQSLSKKLNSYTCEPHDSSCFEKFYDLKRSFQLFNAHQNRLAEMLKKKDFDATRLNEDIRQHLARFKQLEVDMASYLLRTKRHF